MPEEEQLIELLLYIVAEYFEPNISYSVIETWLKNIVQEVLSRLKRKHPTHSVFSISPEQFLNWKNNNIDDNFWETEKETKQIMYILEEYICNELDLHELSLWNTLGLKNDEVSSEETCSYKS